MPVRPDVVAGYAKPKRKAKAKKAPPKPGTQGPARRGASQPKGPVARPKASPRPKVDTGNILKSAAPNTVKVKPKGAKHATTVDTGDILQGHGNVHPRRAPAKRPSFSRALKDELEGKGTLTEGAKRVADAVGKNAVVVSGGAGPTVATNVGRNLGGGRASTASGKSHTAAILAPKAVKAPKIIGRTIKDAFNFPATAIPSAYVPAAAAVEAARGRPQRGKQLLHDLPHTDAGAALLTGHPGRALKLANEHPGFAALEAIGAKGAIGRGVGRVLRAAPKGSAAHRAGSTRRADRVGPTGTDLRQEQSYSPDVGRKAVQVAVERRRAKRAAAKRKEAADVHVDRPERAQELLAQANRIDPTRMSDNEVRRRVNESVSSREVMRRQNRTVVGEQAHRAITNTQTPTGSPRTRVKMIARNRKTKTKPTAATSLHTQAITDASIDDLRAYHDELVAQYAGLGDAGQLANRTLRAQIRRAIAKNPDPVKLHAAAVRYEEVMAPRQHALAEHGMLAPEQVDKAKLVPYATRHMGARHGKPAIEDVTANDVRRAKAQRRRAERAVLSATRRAAKSHGRAGVLVARADERALRSDPAYRKAALALSKAQREMRQAKMAHGNAHRNEGLWTRAERIAIEQRAAKASQELTAAREHYQTVRAAREQALAPVLDKRPVATLRSTERAQSGLKLATVRRDAALANVVEVKRAARAARAAKRRPPQLLDRHGDPLSAARIREHMAARGVHEPAYVTQAPGQRGARNFYVASGRPPQISSGVRTGAATAKGTFDAHPETLIEGASRAQGLVDAADHFAANIQEFAHKPTLGKLKTKKQADNAARDLFARTGERYRPVRVNPFGGRQEQLQALLDHPSGTGDLIDNVGAQQPVREAMISAMRGEDGAGPWALMPEPAAAQFAQHLHNLGVGPKAKAGQVIGSGFRRTVLATSPTWMAGNVTEATGRAALGRAGPRSYVTGRRFVRAVEARDPALAAELKARAIGGGHFAMADRQHIRRDSTQFAGGRVLEPLARGLGAFWRAPGPKHLAQAWHGWTDLVFRQLNGRLESHFQTAMLGKVLRDSPLMDGELLKASQHAVDRAAAGLVDINDVVPLARGVERMYGQYSAFSPDMRWQIATYTPFVAWTVNAVKFVVDVLPRDHPLATALLASTEQATEEWRKDHGLDLFMAGALPGFLQGSIPLSGGRHQRAPFRYTPFGAFGDIFATAGNAVLPQFSGVLAAFRGEDWKGKKLTKADGSPADTIDKAKAAAGAFIDSTVPIVALAKRVIAKGPSALNPAQPVQPATDAGGGGSDSSGIDFSTLDTESVDPGSIDFSTVP